MHVVEAVDPFASLRALTTDVDQPEGERDVAVADLHHAQVDVWI